MIIKALSTVCLAFTLMLFAADTYAADVAKDETDIVGTILEVEGEATITGADGKSQPAVVNNPVRTNDVLATGPKSRLYVMLIDQTELTLSENGQMSVDEYFFDDSDNTDNSATYSVVKGAFLYVSGLVAKKEKPDVTVNIPSGSIGIRGTRFWGGEVDGEYGVLVGDGEVEVDTGTATKARLKKGEGTTLRGRGIAPDPVKAWGKPKIDKAVQTVTLKRPEVVGKRIETEKRERQQYLRERHKITQMKQLEKLRTEVETANPDLKGKLTRQDLLKLRREHGGAPAAVKPLQGGTSDKQGSRPVLNKSEAAREAIRMKAEASREAIRTKADNAREAIREKAQAARENAGSITTNRVEPVVNTATDTVKEVTTPVVNTVKETAEPVVNTVKDTAEPVVNKVTEPVKPVLKKVPLVKPIQ